MYKIMDYSMSRPILKNVIITLELQNNYCEGRTYYIFEVISVITSGQLLM